MLRVPIVASLTALEELERVPPELLAHVDILEVRADLVGDVNPEWLRSRFGGELLLTLRSTAEGGRFRQSSRERARRILELAPGFDLVDLEVERDLTDEVLAAIPETRRVLSWHGPLTTSAELDTRMHDLSRIGARYRKLIPHAQRAGQDVLVLKRLRESRGQGLVCFCTGEVGAWTRLMAPHLGSALIFVSLGEQPAAPGQLSLRQVVDDYGLPDQRAREKIFGIVGSPVASSLSPRLHNGAYRELDLPYLLLPFEAPRFGDFWLEVVEDEMWEELNLALAGFAVTTPHKGVALAVAGVASARSQRVEAANTLVHRGDVWFASTTDPEGVTLPLSWRGLVLTELPVLVLGVGGAGRAAIAGLRAAGARVVTSNRDADRGRKVAGALGVSYRERQALDVADFSVVVNATPLGREEGDELPFDVDRLGEHTVVVDLVYGARPTPLVEATRHRGLDAVDGREVLLAQAVPQFEQLTGRQLPLLSAAGRLGVELPEGAA